MARPVQVDRVEPRPEPMYFEQSSGITQSGGSMRCFPRTGGQHLEVGPAVEAQSLLPGDIRRQEDRTARGGVRKHSQEMARAGVNVHRRKTCFRLFRG